MKKILVNVNEENLEKIRDEWAGMRGCRSSNSDIVNELMMSELYHLKQIHEKLRDFGTFKNVMSPSYRKSVRTLDEAIKEKRK